MRTVKRPRQIRASIPDLHWQEPPDHYGKNRTSCLTELTQVTIIFRKVIVNGYVERGNPERYC